MGHLLVNVKDYARQYPNNLIPKVASQIDDIGCLQ